MKVDNRTDTGGLHTQKTFGYDVEELKLLQVSPRDGTVERSRRNH